MEAYENEKYKGMDLTPLSPGNYALYIFLASLPLVGIILLIVWAFSSGGNLHQKNWAKGMLLLMVIVYGFIILTFFGLLSVGFLGRFLSDYY